MTKQARDIYAMALKVSCQVMQTLVVNGLGLCPLQDSTYLF